MAEGIIRVRCVGRYINRPRNLRYFPGDEIEADPRLWGILSADAPECFEVVEEAGAKAPDAPPNSKAVLEPRGKK